MDLQDWRIIFSWSVNRCENSRCSSNAPGTPHVSACDAAAARVSSFRAARTSWSLVLIAAAIAVFLFQRVDRRDISTWHYFPIKKTRRQSNCPYENKNKLTCSRKRSFSAGFNPSTTWARFNPTIFFLHAASTCTQHGWLQC